jgi:hypothetical protein
MNRFLRIILYIVVLAALAAGAFYFGFRFATESDMTVGDLLRFLRQLYQWFGFGS